MKLVHYNFHYIFTLKMPPSKDCYFPINVANIIYDIEQKKNISIWSENYVRS